MRDADQFNETRKRDNVSYRLYIAYFFLIARRLGNKNVNKLIISTLFEYTTYYCTLVI